MIALAVPVPASAQTSLPPSLEVRVPKPPTVATADGVGVLAYEVHITNFATSPVTLRRLDAVGPDGSVVGTYEDTTLASMVSRPGTTGIAGPEKLTLAGGMRAVAFVWLPLAGPAPSAVRHQVAIGLGTGDSVRVGVLEGPDVPVEGESMTIGPPLRGGPWLTANGPAPATGHRRALIPVGGVPAIAQRFAIDYVLVGEDGRTFAGDRLENEAYHAWGEEVLAVADGTVVAVKDGIPENVPGPASRAVPITLETVGGNHVILDLGGGAYAFYAHLQPGSLRVAVGTRVRRGDVLGLVGNSGNSTEPHLHFHLSDGNSPLGSEGIPYRLDAFEIVGRCIMPGGGCTSQPPDDRRGELPLGNRLVRFPDGRRPRCARRAAS